MSDDERMCILVELILITYASLLVGTFYLNRSFLIMSLISCVVTIVYGFKYAPNIDCMGYEH